MTPDSPFISVIMPVRNEERHIGACLRSLLRTPYPPDRWEIILIDGMSKDKTREEIAKVAETTRVPVIVLDNPRGITPIALNIGITHSRGEIIIRADAHAAYGDAYISRCVKVSQETSAENVGGPVNTRPGDKTLAAQAIALIMSHPFGVGNSAFRTSTKQGEVDTVPFGCFRAEIFQRIGMFDERLRRNQDYEFNQRIRRHGGRVVIDPRLTSAYISRPSMTAMIAQAWDNGFWVAILHTLHPKTLSPRHVLPGLFALLVTAGISLAIAGVIGVTSFIIWGLLALYVILNVITATTITMRKGWRLWPFLLCGFAALHLAYGFGNLAGWITILLGWTPWHVNDGIPTLSERREHQEVSS